MQTHPSHGRRLPVGQPLHGGPALARGIGMGYIRPDPTASATRVALHTDPLIGTTLDGRYEILEHLAEGGFGSVYRAQHTSLGRAVAIKVVHRYAPQVHGERLVQEARLLAAINHPRVVPIYDGGRLPDGRPFLAEAFIQGTTLEAALAAATRLDPARAVRLMIQLLEALDAVHEIGVVHRDLKPSNVMLVDERGEEAIRLIDFGIARAAAPTDPREMLTATGAIIGTPTYMAPEQIDGGALGPATDVYAVGTILYELLVGQPPFDRGNPIDTLRSQLYAPLPELPPTIPKALQPVIRQALAKSAADRFDSAGAMAEALRVSMGDSLGLDERYEVLELLGSGSFGLVLLARHRVLKTKLAIKIGTATDGDARARFEREAQILASLTHPGLVSVHDSGGLPDGRLFMVQEWIDGQPLSALLADGPLPIERAIGLAIGVLVPLQAAHEAGVIHRDLKPDNVMVEAGDRVRIIDFGLARSAQADEEALTTLGLFVGTLAYAAPEQSSRDGITSAADQYAVGIMLYQMLAGRRPFEADNLPELARMHHTAPLPPLPEHVPPDLRAVVERATAKRAEDRFGSAEEMAAALLVRDAPPEVRRRRVLLATVALTVLLVALGVIIAALAVDSAPSTPGAVEDEVVMRVGAVTPETRVADLKRELADCRCDRAHDVLRQLDVEAPEVAANWRPQWESRCAGSTRTCAEGAPR